MLLNGSENEKLFAKLVPVSLKDVYTNQSRTSYLFLTMEWQEATAGAYNRKVLVISLTDNNDPFFLYNLHLSEEDFQMLKTNQDLLINFSSFPQHIIDYIEMCLREEKNPQPKFLLVFTLNDKLGSVATPSQLDIVETNQFKHLIHLTLKFIAATDSAVRQYLASCFRHLKEEKRHLQSSLAFMEQDLKGKLAAIQYALEKKGDELEIVKKELNVELNMKDSKHALELQEERDRLLNRLKEEESRFEREREEKEHKFRREIQQLESRVNVLDDLNKDLRDKNYKYESTIRELKSKVHSLEEETKRLKENIQTYKQKCDNLHSDAKSKQTHIRQQDEIIHDLQQEIRTKEQVNVRLKDQIDCEKESKKCIEAELDNLRFQLDMNEKSRNELKTEKDEKDDMIVTLQEKIKSVTKEEKTKGQVAAKYKKMVDEKEKTLLDVKREVAELNISVNTRSAEIKYLTDSNCLLQKKLDELEKELKNRDSVIKWLNKQLTDRCIFPVHTSPSNLITSPSSVAQQQLAKISSSPESSPTSDTVKTVASKSVRIETVSPVHRKSSSTPSRFHNTQATDSAYCTSPSGYTNSETLEIVHGNHKVNFDPANFEADPKALSAAFGSGDHTFKHSTAKKPNKPGKSTIPRVSKKR